MTYSSGLLISIKKIAGEGNFVKLDTNIGSLSVKGEEQTNDLIDKSKGPLKAHGLTGPDSRCPTSLLAIEVHVVGQKIKLKLCNSK